MSDEANLDNFPPTPGVPTPVPSEEQRRTRMAAAGVPEQYWDWMGPHGVSAMCVRLGMRFVEMSPEKMVATLPVAGNEQNAGIFHGGGHFVLAETLGSVASIFHVQANLGLERAVVGTELSATHHRSATSGLVTATCTPINLGKQLCVHQIVMTDDAGRRLSTARMTNMILQPRP
ncbi:hotdog fold thioesterase [Nesterenkonia ebinurensis]|uniref:hotdog fold thioesterase n=1 Tax=Nesterenkonia ebinurensis TaxID=2608252 RepID=UPI00123CA23B|nr:hotdog fold thioesterase [Nesterenkonia ebinurensis]